MSRESGCGLKTFVVLSVVVSPACFAQLMGHGAPDAAAFGVLCVVPLWLMNSASNWVLESDILPEPLDLFFIAFLVVGAPVAYIVAASLSWLHALGRL